MTSWLNDVCNGDPELQARVIARHTINLPSIKSHGTNTYSFSLLDILNERLVDKPKRFITVDPATGKFTAAQKPRPTTV